MVSPYDGLLAAVLDHALDLLSPRIQCCFVEGSYMSTMSNTSDSMTDQAHANLALLALEKIPWPVDPREPKSTWASHERRRRHLEGGY